MDPTAHYEHSTLRERIVEQIFLGEILRRLWCRSVVTVEVLRSDFDAHGYDLVLAHNRTVRHIQLKTGTSIKPVKVSVAQALAEKPSGCLIWIKVSPALDMGPFFWFGSTPGEPLPPIYSFPTPLRPTHNKEGVRPPRHNHRLIPGREFKLLKTVDEVINHLFSFEPNIVEQGLGASAGWL